MYVVIPIAVLLSYNSSYIGSGLCIFSKYPILSVISHQFRVTGGMRIFYDGEIFAGKGVLCCKLQTPQGTITIFNTHVSIAITLGRFQVLYIPLMSMTSIILKC